MKWLPWLMLSGAALLAACAGLPQAPDDPNCVAIGRGGWICPLPPAALAPVDARHLVTVSHQGQADTFLGRLRIDDKALRLAGASLFGTHLFSITWDGRTLTTEPASGTMHPRLMLVMLQVALADPAQMRPQLRGLELATSRHSGVEVRTLSLDGHPVARIERRGERPRAATFDIRVPRAKLHLHLKPLTETP